jgi:hypothetical protein
MKNIILVTIVIIAVVVISCTKQNSISPKDFSDLKLSAVLDHPDDPIIGGNTQYYRVKISSRNQYGNVIIIIKHDTWPEMPNWEQYISHNSKIIERSLIPGENDLGSIPLGEITAVTVNGIPIKF